MATIRPALSGLWAKVDRPGVRAFLLSMVALSIALVLALYSGAAAQLGNLFLASASALTALLVAANLAAFLIELDQGRGAGLDAFLDQLANDVQDHGLFVGGLGAGRCDRHSL